MPRFQPIYDIAQLCAQKGITQAVLCPGSRCAPITIAFARHDEITVRTFSDERSAAFIASGIAHQTQSPTILVCTSGSAAFNFAPAIAEAFFQEIPLLVFTADRPKEWIDQLDGQTIRQNNIFGSHVKKTFTVPEDYDHPDAVWFIHRAVNEAINLAQEFPRGPVHINIPFREPLYPAKDEKIKFNKNVKEIKANAIAGELTEGDINELHERLNRFSKIVILAGQNDFDDELAKSVEKFSNSNHAPVVGDILSNLHSKQNVIRYADSFLGACPEDVKASLQPELLVTFCKSIISKNTKLFLRKYKPKEHWHIQPNGPAADTFQSLTEIIHCQPKSFFKALNSSKGQKKFESQKKENFKLIWEAEEHRIVRSMNDHFKNASFSELLIVKEFISQLPARCNLHLANSMAVRYANLIGVEATKKGLHVYANRGASGIDGCTSTAVGHALSNATPNFLITGDMAFFYDRNAFWHNYALPNLHVLVLNNHGGIIFNVIDGPGNVAELKEFFVTDQKLSARHLCSELNYDYLHVDSEKKIRNSLKDFLVFDSKTKILEFESTQEENKEAYQKFKQKIKEGYGT
ncbi:MAG TPA: 2-succinyl-5-enolpyruvyl-6-hydroxy-3-cyclohexene-1-carboxylic-acid synthase [Cytophagales bacterium]|nr:2-succinyl-5-enolpyruvyl-6-hydroxy-3-cyclohexene-1-carboxylic-acid synthase [Cytophagales bacterium]